MIRKLKICMIGATGVGKTSLVSRFVSSIFSERYKTTIGVRIQSRRIQLDGEIVDAVLWDISGEDEFQNVQPAYLRGAAGYLFVVDGMRPETLEIALKLHERTRDELGAVPRVLVLNKRDLEVFWEVDAKRMAALEREGWTIVRTSAKTGDGVEEAFKRLVGAVLALEGKRWI
jgi:small GTP-binding protein